MGFYVNALNHHVTKSFPFLKLPEMICDQLTHVEPSPLPVTPQPCTISFWIRQIAKIVLTGQGMGPIGTSNATEGWSEHSAKLGWQV
jgi:hypothetical protein